MPTAAEKARKDALDVQKKRTDEAIARRTTAIQQGSTQSSKVAATRPKVAAASAKRKQIQTAAFQSPLKRHKPMSTSKLVPTADCVRCHVRNETPRIKCIFCNASVHHACTTPVASALGLPGFPDESAYCSLQCYTDDTGNPVPTPAPTVERPSHVKAVPAPLPAASTLAPTPTIHRRTKPSDFVEGEAITSAILKHSGVKAPRPLEIPSRSLPSRRPPSPERKTLQFESTSPIERPERASSNAPTARTVEVERVRYVNATAKDTSPSIEDDVRYHDYFNPPRFLPRTRSQPSLATPSAASWSKRSIAAGAVIVLVGILAAYAAMFMESIPFCDSNASTTGPTAHGFCHPCPDYGICFSGDLQSCKEPYLKVERACLEPSTVSRDADLMTQLLPRFLVKRATSALCNATLLSALLANESSKTSLQVVTNAFHLRNYLLHQAMWDKVDAAVFDMTFHKAMRQLKQARPEFYYTSDGDVVLNRDDVEVWCAVQLHLQDNVEIYAGLLVVLLTSWAIFTWQRRRRATASQIKRLVHAVHVALKQPSNDLVDGAVSHLRHTLWGGKADHTWQRVVQAIHDDARIRERYILHRGQQVLIWEWIGTRRDDRNILRGQPVELVE